ncbi:MAG: class I SAM-dependent methyltransferase [Pseudomonadota bacterium]
MRLGADIPLIAAPEYQLAAQRLAEQYHLSFVDEQASSGCLFRLRLTSNGLELEKLQPEDVKPKQNPHRVDYTDPGLRQRLRPNILFGDPLIRALGLKPTEQTPNLIWDISLGYGIDAFIMAASGAHVIGFEQHPIIFALTDDARLRALQCAETQPIAQRLEFHCGIASEQVHQRPQRVYFDPMFHEEKTARPHKAMAWLQEVVTEQPNPVHMLEQALQWATKRVVVKQPRNAPQMLKPSFSHQYATCRFDVYLTSK